MKRLEIFLGDRWQAWTASDIVSLKKVGQKVTIKTKITPEGEKPFVLTTEVKLNMLPAYSIA